MFTPSPRPVPLKMSRLDIPPPDAASIAKAKADAIAERHAVLELVTTARQGALYLLDFYPEALAPLLEYFCLAESFGPQTMERAIREVRSERYGVSSPYDPRR